MRLNASEAALMITIHYCTGQGENNYTRASINKFRELLARFHDTIIGRRWVFQCLRHLEDNGYIKRVKRYLNNENGHIRQIPSLWKFTTIGISWLVSRGVERARELKKNIITHLKKLDGRFYTEQAFNPPKVNHKAREDIEKAERIAEIVTKPIN